MSKKDKKKKKLTKIPIIFLIISIIIFGLIAFAAFFILGEGFFMELFERPGKPEIKYGEFPFELVYEYNDEEVVINDTIICEYNGSKFILDGGGNKRDWNCFIKDVEFGQYYLDEEKEPSLYIQIPLEAEYYMGNPDFNVEFVKPYIFYIDDNTGTTYYEQDLKDVIGVKILDYKLSEPIKNNFK